jgi:hypothetical protein
MLALGTFRFGPVLERGKGMSTRVAAIPSPVTDDEPVPLFECLGREIVLMEDPSGFVEMVEVSVVREGRRPRLFQVDGAKPPRRGCRPHRPRAAEVDEAAETGVYLRVTPRGPAMGAWMPLARAPGADAGV